MASNMEQFYSDLHYMNKEDHVNCESIKVLIPELAPFHNYIVNDMWCTYSRDVYQASQMSFDYNKIPEFRDFLGIPRRVLEVKNS